VIADAGMRSPVRLTVARIAWNSSFCVEMNVSSEPYAWSIFSSCFLLSVRPYLDWTYAIPRMIVSKSVWFVPRIFVRAFTFSSRFTSCESDA
jgi:hypothetical protein